MAEIKRAIALGFFDGVHIGHGALLRKTKERAAETGALASVLSFDVHPDTLVFGNEVPLINSALGREDLIRRLYGIDMPVRTVGEYLSRWGIDVRSTARETGKQLLSAMMQRK